MISVRKFISSLFFVALVSPVLSSEYEDFDSNMLLAQRSRGTEKNNSSYKEKPAKSPNDDKSVKPKEEKPKEAKPTRPREERPSRPHEGRHPHPHSLHYGHGDGGHGSSEVVVVVEDDAEYVSTNSDYSSKEEVKSGDFAIDKFMLFANIGCGLSYRGVSGRIDDGPDEEEEDADFLSNSLGYNVEIRFDVELAKHVLLSSGVGFSKQTVYNEFFPGNYMVSTKRFCDIPLMVGYRISPDEDFIASVALGPRFAYGINGTCREYYDFFPEPEYGVFKHDTYDGKYGLKRFSVGGGIEANFILYRFLLGCNFSFYPKNDCIPDELYDGLYRRIHGCRTNFTIKVGWRIF